MTTVDTGKKFSAYLTVAIIFWLKWSQEVKNNLLIYLVGEREANGQEAAEEDGLEFGLSSECSKTLKKKQQLSVSCSDFNENVYERNRQVKDKTNGRSL